tara:strand:+ start:14 stop:316 length:303 start_codon:yes stop_codon:yes gene_type:complete
MKKKITVEEFFRIKQMLQGLPDDRALGCVMYNNSNYADKDILDKLMCKALMFDARVKFCIAINYGIKLGSLKLSRIYQSLERRDADKVYIDILRKIKDYD